MLVLGLNYNYDEYGRIKLITVLDKIVGVYVGSIFYPMATDHLSSTRALFSGEEVLFRREYSAYGFKTVTYKNKNDSFLTQLEEKIPFSFAGLIEIPKLNNQNQIDRTTPANYISKSRVYSPNLREWLSVDPLIIANPSPLLSNSGNFNTVLYVNGDPLNLVDPISEIV